MSAKEKDRRTASGQSDADAHLAMAAASEAASRALRAGSRAPLFKLADTEGQPTDLEDLLRVGPVVLHFFRGAWCSFGEQSAAEFAATHQDVVALGASAVAIAPPSNRAARRHHLPIRELQDANMKVARAYGLAFNLPVGLRHRYEQMGYTPPLTSKPDTWLVPIPATYLLDRSGIVTLTFIDVDYRRHLAPGALLTALRALQTREARPRRTPRR